MLIVCVELYQTVGLPAVEMNSIPSPLSGDDQLYAVEVNDSNDVSVNVCFVRKFTFHGVCNFT